MAMSEMRLIDANKLERWLKTRMANENPLHCDIKETYSECITMVHCMETIDAVSVVRCRECYYRDKPTCCPYQYSGFKVEPDWYCPMGVNMAEKEG